MRREKRIFEASFKARIALEAIRELKTINQIAAEHELHPNQVSVWKKQLLEGSAEIFKDGKGPSPKQDDKQEELYGRIGKLSMEVEWLKKKSEQFLK